METDMNVSVPSRSVEENIAYLTKLSEAVSNVLASPASDAVKEAALECFTRSLPPVLSIQHCSFVGEPLSASACEHTARPDETTKTP
jgi:hypothetical protein